MKVMQTKENKSGIKLTTPQMLPSINKKGKLGKVK